MIVFLLSLCLSQILYTAQETDLTNDITALLLQSKKKGLKCTKHRILHKKLVLLFEEMKKNDTLPNYKKHQKLRLSSLEKQKHTQFPTFLLSLLHIDKLNGEEYTEQNLTFLKRIKNEIITEDFENYCCQTNLDRICQNSFPLFGIILYSLQRIIREIIIYYLFTKYLKEKQFFQNHIFILYFLEYYTSNILTVTIINNLQNMYLDPRDPMNPTALTDLKILSLIRINRFFPLFLYASMIIIKYKIEMGLQKYLLLNFITELPFPLIILVFYHKNKFNDCIKGITFKKSIQENATKYIFSLMQKYDKEYGPDQCHNSYLDEQLTEKISVGAITGLMILDK